MKGYKIKRIVGSYYDVDMDSPRRFRKLVRPRQIAQYLCRMKTSLSFMQIAELFGRDCHTTAMHSNRFIEQLRQEDSELDDEIEDILKIIENMQN